MKKILIVLLAVVFIPVLAWAGETSVYSGFFWSVSNISDQYSSQRNLIHRRVQFKRIDGKEMFSVEAYLGEEIWPVISLFQLGDRVWTRMDSSGQTEIKFDFELSAKELLKLP